MHAEPEATGTRLVINSKTCLLAEDRDPSQILAASPGKLVRFLVEDGARVHSDQPFAEVEVMKMVMTLLAPAAGTIFFERPEGSVLVPGERIARLDLDASQPAASAKMFEDTLPPGLGPPQLVATRVDQRFSRAVEDARMLLKGYELPVAELVDELAECLDDPSLPLLQWRDALAAVETRIPPALALSLRSDLDAFAVDVQRYESGELNAEQLQFPGSALHESLLRALAALNPAERRMLTQQCERLLQLAELHRGGMEDYARRIVTELFEDFVKVEELFQVGERDRGRSPFLRLFLVSSSSSFNSHEVNSRI